MPLTRFAADAFGVVTISLVALLIILGLLCILYTFYFKAHIRSQGFVELNYFNGPWLIRVIFILVVIWWGLGEISRLSLLRHEGRILNALNTKWQDLACKCYIISNLGFAEPCIFLTLIFLLRAPLEKMESGVLNRRWSKKIGGYIILCCFPVFVLQVIMILAGPELNKLGLKHYFTRVVRRSDNIVMCTYPLLSSITLGIFVIVLTLYLLWLGRQILKLVLNKVLQKRVQAILLSASSFLPLRVILLGLSASFNPENIPFEVITFSAFLALLACAGLCICVLVYFPVADSLALGNLRDLEARRRAVSEYYVHETSSLITNRSFPEQSPSSASTKRGSVSFRAYEEAASVGTSVELSRFSPDPIPSPPQLGWPMRSFSHTHDEPPP